MTKEQLQKGLLKHFGTKDRLVEFAENCKYLGFPIGDNIDKVEAEIAHFNTLITWQDIGVLPKLIETMKKLKGEQ
ncbi:MAG: hypothetical protein K0U78_14715 [Actinomycetia bacterium]|nr:hypothetical protein [Actinomycetes bacterium]